jgi:hypothetical protein
VKSATLSTNEMVTGILLLEVTDFSDEVKLILELIVEEEPLLTKKPF